MNSDISLPHKIVLTESLNNQKNVYVNIFKNHKVLPKKKQTGPALTGENKFQKNAEKYLKRAIIYYENNTPPLAVKAMQQALESWPWIIKKADSNLISLVEERCKRVLLLNPAAAKAYFALGCISLYYNNSTEADKYFSTLKKIDPDSKLLELVTKFNSQPLNSAAPVNIDLNFMDLNSYSQKHTTDISANGPVKTGKGAIENTGIIKFKVAGSVQGRYYVKVCLESLDQKFSRTVEAMEGKFSFINIPPGIYRVYPLIGTKTINYDESVTVKDDFTAYESVEIEVLDHHISGLEILISE
jgi:tetratricopeptide (TPR) repeat protein